MNEPSSDPERNSDMDLGLTGKSIFITGGSGGINAFNDRKTLPTEGGSSR